MATKYLVGLDLSNTASWSSSDGGAGGDGVPSDGDDVIMNQGDGEITGVAQFATTVPATITVTSNCRLYTPAGSPITIGDGTNTCTDIVYEGQGKEFSLSASAANAVDAITINSANGVVNITKATEATAIDSVDVSRGTVNLRGALKPTTVRVYGGLVDSRGGGTITTFETNGGRSTVDGSITTARVTGSGRLVQTTGSNTTVEVYGGYANLRSPGTTTTLNHRGGTVSPEGGTHTITTANLYGTSTTTKFIKTVGLSSFSVGTTNKYGTVSEQSSDGSTNLGAGA